MAPIIISRSTLPTVRSLPTLNITTIAPAATSQEGRTFNVVMGISPNTHAGFSFNYAVADSGDVGGFYQATNVGNNTAANPFVLAANSADVTFTILTNNQATATGHGEITFELLPGAGYKLGATTETQNDYFRSSGTNNRSTNN